MRALGIHHVGMAVRDLDEAVATYGRLFAGELERRATVEEQGVEEERRLFYVAMTRAKDALHLMTSLRF